MSNFKKGDRIAYIESGNTGVVEKVHELAGTVVVRYDDINSGKFLSTHTLAESKLRHALPGERTVNCRVLSEPYTPPQGGCGSDESDAVPQGFYLSKENPQNAEEPKDTRTNQLLNELYHDRARLENTVERAVALIKQAGDAIEDAQQIVDSADMEARRHGFEVNYGPVTTRFKESSTLLLGKIAEFEQANG